MSRKPMLFNRHRDGHPQGAIYIGRGTPWGNPYGIDEVLKRENAILAYRWHLIRNSDFCIQIKLALQGKDLLCSCTPAPCHGDILLLVANATDIEHTPYGILPKGLYYYEGNPEVLRHPQSHPWPPC